MMADPGSGPGQVLVAARRRAEAMAYALGIALYLRPDGTIAQNGPGERIDPPKGAAPTPHGHGTIPQAAAIP